MSARFTGIILALPVLGALGCGSDSTTAGEVLVVASLEISPPDLTLVAGSTGQLNAVPKTSSGITVPNRQVTWSSDDAGIATVSSEGVVTGISPGGTRVNARVDGVSASIAVDVSPKAVATVTVTPAQVSLMVGETGDLTVIARSEDDETLTGRPVTFASDNPEIATVSDAGRVTAISAGLTVITATVEGKSGTANVSVDALPASQLDFQNQPGTGAAGSPIPPVRVEVQNSQGGTVSEGTMSITLALADNPTGATLSGTLTVVASNGVATFSNLRINEAGSGYTLRATAGTLTPAESSPFAIVAGSASRLAIATQPSPKATSGAAFAVQPQIQIRDAEGNPVEAAGVDVTAVLQGSGATLRGDLTVATNSAGLAMYTDLAISGETGTYTLLFAAPGLTSVASDGIALTGGAPTALVLLQQPSPTAVAGEELGRPPIVQLVDVEGNPVGRSGVTVTAAIQSGAGTLGGTLTVPTDGGGRAAFGNLILTGPPGDYTLGFTATGLAGVTSMAIALTAAPPTDLSITTQPSTTAVSGQVLATQPVLALRNSTGGPVTGSTITATINSGPSGSTLANATAVTNASGVATFSGLAITGDPGDYTLKFATGPLSAVSGTITISPPSPQATQLLIATAPSTTTTSGAALGTQPAIQIADAGGAAVSQAGTTITAVIASGPSGASLANATAATNASGRATFNGLAISGDLGTYTIRFESGSLDPATSAGIVLGAGEASALAIITQPPQTTVNGAVLSSSVVQVRDAAGNGLAGVVVTASRASGSGELKGTLSRTTASNGRATFDDLSLTGLVGSYTIRYATPRGIGAQSRAITLTPGADVALAVITQPPAKAKDDKNINPDPQIELRDQSGNTVTRSGVAITAALEVVSGNGKLNGTRERMTSTGVATFNDLRIKGKGTYRFLFSAPGHGSVTSAQIQID
ncbi:MAG TPA: Ig-like domain-containing protein [Gemmatimonadales bacterium]|nr:Ig-like domain-containing protein [Gemmatimonadales bacterium]